MLHIIAVILERRNVGDKWLMQLSKEITIDNSIPYDILK
jgi:hypothetical protein